MGKKLKAFNDYFWRHKYVWSILIFVAIISFLDSNSLWRRWEKRQENEELRSEIKKYEKQCSKDSTKLKQLISNPEAIIKVARETHLMKSEDEDVYIVSIQKPDNQE